jgi:hypothetical protein
VKLAFEKKKQLFQVVKDFSPEKLNKMSSGGIQKYSLAFVSRY